MDDDVPVLGSILGVWAHPDDEAYLSAGLMAVAVEAGHHVCCVTATRGELGFPDDDPRSVEERSSTHQTRRTHREPAREEADGERPRTRSGLGVSSEEF